VPNLIGLKPWDRLAFLVNQLESRALESTRNMLSLIQDYKKRLSMSLVASVHMNFQLLILYEYKLKGLNLEG
jgi:hypothetical protein